MEVRTTDYHTGGEPFRIVTSVEVPGATVADRRTTVSEDVDRVRRMLCHEPRGHADMYGGFVVPPDDAGADLGVLFWHKDGYSTACGHGTIALGAWAVESGRVAVPQGADVVDVTIDVPSGRVVARVRLDDGGEVDRVGFRNVPARVVARGVAAGDVTADLAWGGALYAFVDLPLGLHANDLPRLIAAGRAVKAALPEHDLYGTVFTEHVAPGHERNVTVFADGEVDRSPCGSATSARLALLHDADGTTAFRNASIIGSTFDARVLGTAPEGLLTEVEGTAFRTGEHLFVLDPRDPLGTGFVLR